MNEIAIAIHTTNADIALNKMSSFFFKKRKFGLRLLYKMSINCYSFDFQVDNAEILFRNHCAEEYENKKRVQAFKHLKFGHQLALHSVMLLSKRK